MSNEDIYTGLWRDWRDDSPLNHRLTLSGSASNALIAAIGIWVGTFTSSWVWSILMYIIHGISVSRPRDGIRAQHQVVWRNDGDPLTAMKDNLRIWAYNWPLVTRSNPPASNGPNGKGFVRARTSAAVISSFIFWSGFIIAAIFAPMVADPNGDVLLSAKLEDCGILQYPESPETIQDVSVQYMAKILNDTLSGRAYARTCYSGEFSSSRSASCKFYTVSTLPYMATSISGNCPFSSDPNQLFLNGPCAAPPSEYHNGSYLMYTDLLDSSTHFGINARPQDRILLQNNLSCSPLTLSNRSRSIPGLGTMANVSYAGYFFGKTGSYGDSDYTYFHNSNADTDNVPYTVDAVYSDAGPNRGVWIPDYPFNITDGDVSLFFFSANSVTYKTVVNDPFFRSSAVPDRAPSGLSSGPQISYKPFLPVQVMGCVDLYRLCRYSPGAPDDKNCTPSLGRLNLLSAKNFLPQTQAQNVTLSRIYDMINNSDTYSSVYATGTAALKASDAVLGLSSPGLRSDQWHLEVEGWFQNTLSKMQGYAVEYANHVSGVGENSRLVFLDDVADNATWNAQCGNQRISSLGGHQSFSVFGLLFIFAFDMFFRIVNNIRKTQTMDPPTRRSMAHLADGQFELQAMAMRNGNDVEVLQTLHGMPIYRPGSSLPRPRMDGGHITYAPAPQQLVRTQATGNEPLNNVVSNPSISTSQPTANDQAAVPHTSTSDNSNAALTASPVQASAEAPSSGPGLSTTSQPPEATTTQADASNAAAAPNETTGASNIPPSTSHLPSNNFSHSTDPSQLLHAHSTNNTQPNSPPHENARPTSAGLASSITSPPTNANLTLPLIPD